MEEDLKYLSLPDNTVLNAFYKIIETLNISDLSIVYKGLDLRTQEEIVIKEYFPQGIVLRDLDGKTLICKRASHTEKYSNLLKEFLYEGKILKSLRHKNIEQYISDFTENNTGYIVVRYYEGRTIDKFMKEEKDVYMADFLHKVFIPILKAVRYIHRKGIIHRDLKTSNIILTKEGCPIIIDFGSSVYYKEKKDNHIFVTPGFSPLEFYSEKSIQGKFSDIYSIGATLYHYLCGMIPVEAIDRVLVDEIIEIKSYNEEISKFLSATIMKSLALYPEKRLSSLRVFSIVIYLQVLLLKIKGNINLLSQTFVKKVERENDR